MNIVEVTKLVTKSQTQDEISCEDLVKGVYMLNDLEFETFCTLIDLGKAKVNDLQNVIEKDRTMISRALKSLFEKELVFRKSETENMERGYYHIYWAKSLDNLAEEMNQKIESWYKLAKMELPRIKERFNERHSK